MAGKGTEVAWVRLRSTTGAWLVHPGLRDRLVADANEKGTTLTDLLVQILSGFFGVPYSPNVRKSAPKEAKDVLNFGVSTALKSAIVRAYPTQSWTDTIRYVLCSHYGLRVPVKTPQVRRRRSIA